MAARAGSDGGGGGGGCDDTVELLEISRRIRQALECPVCLDLNADPTCFCPNGHALCAACHVNLAASGAANACPLCRSPLSTTAGGPTTALRLALALPLVGVECRYWPYGCRAVPRVQAAAGHEAACPHNPHVRCLAAACPWLGAYDRLYGHVRDKHPGAAVGTEGNRLTVTDANAIKVNKHRAYLVTADRGGTLMWVLVSRTTRTCLQTGVFVVEPPQEHRGPEGDRQESADMGYRLTYADAEGRCKERSQTRWVGRWPPSSSADDGDVGSYATFRPRTGRVVVHWFEHASGRCRRSRDLGGAPAADGARRCA